MTTLLATWLEPGKVAIEAAWPSYQKSRCLVSAIESGLTACEMDPSLLAIGLGSLPNSDGDIELDASIMIGSDLSAGAVCGVRGIVPVISVARKVLEDTPHILLAGEQARRFAISKGFQPQNLMTDESIRRYDEWRLRPKSPTDEYIHAVGDGHGDTVTMLGRQENGAMVAASSTSGISWKMPGRVGDSPIIGAGIYADDEVGCAGATGYGEELWKACASFRTTEGMRRGLSPTEACEDTIRHMLRRQKHSTDMQCVVFAMDRNGEFGAATSAAEFPLWSCQDGEIGMKLYQPITN